MESVEVRTFEVRKIEPRIIRFISSRRMFVLRNSRTHRALNVSHTPEGLYYTPDSLGLPICFANGAFMKVVDKERLAEGEYKINRVDIVSRDKKPLRMSDKVYIEEFIPQDKPSVSLQIAECTMLDKALKLSNMDAGSFEAESGESA